MAALDQRPDPDRLLERIKEEENREQRGKLKIFFGACAGVGKTYAMLAAARQLLLQGQDVVIGIVETHGRLETEVMTDGFECIPLREVAYQGSTLHEFDLDRTLARHPRTALIDELAHSNVSGSRHPKRWQDVDELLRAGIDVFTTVNVQHLETLNDIVGGITGIRVWETVPDRVFDAADEVILVDLPPDELLQRLRDGKVYLPQQAERAIQNFFRKANLIALRELALRRTADRVDDEMQGFRLQQASVPIWQTRDSLLACIDADDEAERVIRSAARLAARHEVPWHVIHVQSMVQERASSERLHQVIRLLHLAEELGAQTAMLADTSVAAAIVKYARDHNLSHLMIGRHGHHRLAFWRNDLGNRLAALAPDLNITTVARIDNGTRGRSRQRPADEAAIVWRHYAMAVLACVLTTVLALPLHSIFDLANIVMLFLLSVVLVAMLYGRGPSVFACFINVAAFDFFFVPPRLSFAITDAQYLMTFFIMLMVGLITGQLTAGARYQAKVATRREARVRGMYEMARDLSGALLPEQIVDLCDRFVVAEFDARCSILLMDDHGRLGQPIHPHGHALNIDLGIAQWALDHQQAAGFGSDTLPGSPLLYLPLIAPMRIRGVMAIEAREPEILMSPEYRRLLDTCARLISIALERVHYVDVAQDTTVQIESERLRSSLLSAISHDLRTPLAALVGLAESIFLSQPPPSAQQSEIAAAMREELLRMNSQVNNLLDMARLQAGAVRLNLQWQPLEEVVGSALKASAASLAQYQITVELADDLPLLNFDAVLMERVICNLLENAAKYTPQGSRVEIRARIIDADSVELVVEDNGPGLPSGGEQEIFKKFSRGQKESATPGVGLGLAICQAIVEAHNGIIKAENRSEGGARFVFTLPRGTPPALDAECEDMGAHFAPS